MPEKLSATERETELAPLGEMGWGGIAERDAIRKVYVFKNFVEAWGWMTRVSIWCEKWNHHPEWLNVYRTVDVTLTTHDAGGLTELDIRLARKMDSLAATTTGVEYQADLNEPVACLCGLPDPE